MSDAAPAPLPPYLFNLHQLLVAVDLSPYSLQALRLALTLARHAEAEVTAVHVIPPNLSYFERVLFPYAALGADRHDLEAELLEAGKRALLEATDPIRHEVAEDTAADEIYAHILLGPPTTRLRESIDRVSADLVLCGAFGAQAEAGGRSPGQLGGVARRLVASATRPTLLVKTPAGRPHLRRVLVALDGSAASAELLTWATSAALWFGADLEAATIIPDPTRDDPCQLLTKLTPHLEGLARAARERAAQRFARARDGLRVPFPREAQARGLSMRHHVALADPLAGLLELVDERAIDLLVVASRHPTNPYRARFGRVADGVCRLAGCHVLVIPAELCQPREDHA